MITPGQFVGGAGTTVVIPGITVNNGDTMLLTMRFTTSGGTYSASGPGTQTWRTLGASGFQTVLVCDHAVAASGSITITRSPTPASNMIGFVQVFSGVNLVQNWAAGAQFTNTTHPVVTAAVATTLPNSMAIGIFDFVIGTTQGLNITTPTMGQTILGGQSAAYVGQTLATPGSTTLSLDWTATSPPSALGGTSTVVFTPLVTLSSIAVTPASSSIASGGTQQFTATGTYSDGSTQNLTSSVTWGSSATGVATISSGGLATAVGAGTTNITATSGSVTGSTTLTVTSGTGPGVPLPTGVNDISTRQWYLSAPAPFTSGAAAIVWPGLVYIRGLLFSGYSSPSDKCVVKDATGRVVWSANGFTTMEPVRMGRVGWVNGLVLDQLGSGVCMAYIK